MPGRWTDPNAFRADPAAAPSSRPSRRQAISLLAVLATVIAAVAVAAYVVRPEKARAFDLFHGSVFLSDQNSPVAVDLANGKPTLRLFGADKQVGITNGHGALSVVPLSDRTLLLNRSTGEFNMVDNSGFVVKHDGGGVPLVTRAAASTSFGVATDEGQAYIVRTGPTGGTDVYLVGQSTVESAISAAKTVRPRASTSMSEPSSTAPGAAASADGNLWLLIGDQSGTGVRTIRQLSVPADSSPGAALQISDVGSVNGAAAIATASVAADGSGSTAVGVASSSRIDLFVPGSDARIETFAATRDIDKILPTSNGQGRVSFLLHATNGWSVLSVRADGSDLRAPIALDGIPRDAQLAAPAASEGRIYTIDQTSGALYEIGYDGKVQRPAGRSSYPLAELKGHVVEASDLSDAYVYARGPRVVFNSASHTNALMLFTDGSHSAVTIAKSSAVTVNAASGAEALARSTVNPNQKPGKPKPGAPKPKPVQVQPINTKIDCKTAAQKPHIPVITSAVAGSRTVTLAWTYPLIDVQDCYPSTYVVNVKLISNDAPAPPSSVRVQSQTGVTLSGLFPATQYEISVVAYIKAQGTASAPVRITTGKEGPAAPTDLAVTADASGNWTIDFNSCGTAEQGCVAAQSWTITPNFCDDRGVSAPPDPLTVTADPTSRTQPTAVYRGNDDLLGRGLQFQVQGTGDEGQAGAPSARSGCVYSWTPPVTGDISVEASAPAQTAGSQDTTTTTVTVKFAHGQVHDLGGIGGTLEYQLLHDGAVVDTRGPTTDPTVTLSGIRAAENYQVVVHASPPRHPDVVATIGPVDVEPAVAEWPRVILSTPTFDAPAGLSGTLHVSFDFPAGTDSRGETFALVNSLLSCGNTAQDLQHDDVAPGDDMTFPVDRAVYNGPCTVTIQLTQDPRTATNPPLYGAGFSASVTSGSFQIDPPSLTSTASDFDAQWGGTTPHPTVVVSYHGGDDLSGASNWQISVSNGAASCGSVQGNPPPATIDVDKSCIQQGGTFTVIIDYTYFLLAHAHFEIPISGTAPQPVDPTKISFAADWNTNPDLPQVVLTYTGAELLDSLAALNWTEVVASSASPGTVCGSATANPADSTVRIDVDLTACPATGTDGTAAVYTVKISFTDPNYGQTGEYTYTVAGTPPS